MSGFVRPADYQIHRELRELEVETATKLDAIDRLEQRITETEVRLSTPIVGLHGTLHAVRDLLLARAPRTPPG